MTSERGLRITVEDLETGESETRDLAVGDYCLVACAPCYLAHTNHYANGTAVLTVKGRTVGIAETLAAVGEDQPA